MALFFEFIYDFVKKVVDILWAVCLWLLSVPGKIVLFVTTFCGVVYDTLNFVGGHADELVGLFNSATSYVQSLQSVGSNGNVGSFNTLAYCFSLDRAFNYVVSVGGIFLSFVSLVVLALISYVVTFWIVPLALLLVQKIFSVSTGGIVKV